VTNDPVLGLSEKQGVKFAIAGWYAETRDGLLNRADPQLRPFLPKWRRENPVSQFSDVDLWIEPGTPQATVDALAADVQRIFPDKTVDQRYNLYYQTEKSLSEVGAIVFENGTSRRCTAPWQEPGWPLGR
jgi:hypothetical protein